MNHDADVIIVGAGPTGLALASELALAGVSCRLLERRAAESNLTRAFAVHARTLELLDARGLAEQVVNQGIVLDAVQGFPGAGLPLGELPSRYPMLVIAPQTITENVLQQRVEELGVKVERGSDVVGLEQDTDGVRLHVAGPDGDHQLSAGFVVGTDGAHSVIRSLCGIGFEGEEYETHIILADVRLSAPPPEAMFARTNRDGLALVVPFGGGWFRVIIWDRRREDIPLSTPVTTAELIDALNRIVGSDLGLHSARWTTRFLSERRQAARYRAGRVFLAGDAAHVHSPIGGQGMNTGIGDAMNLGWKLAAVVRGDWDTAMLDTYERERHPVGRQVLRMTDGFTRMVLARSELSARLRRTLIRAIVRIAPTRRLLLGRISGIGLRYRHGRSDHPRAGHRVADLTTSSGRLYEVLRAGLFVLAIGPGVDVRAVQEVLDPWSRRVVLVEHTSHAEPPLTLIRPDAYVAWAGDRTAETDLLHSALSRWCGAASDSQRKADKRPPSIKSRMWDLPSTEMATRRFGSSV